MSTILKMIALVAVFIHPTIAIAEDTIPRKDLYKIVGVKEVVKREFADAPIMVHIADAESQYDCTAKNPTSSAKGCFQILDGTWKDHKCVGNVLEPIDNIDCARKLYTKNGTNDWNASRGTWGKYVVQ